MTLFRRTSSQFIALVAFVMLGIASSVAATTVRLTTSLGPIDIVLYDDAPRTMTNFLAYVNSNAYANSFVHRSVPGFVIQGGGFVWNDANSQVSSVTSKGTIANEFSASHSNKRGTIAMAKLGNDPNSATSQWFINLVDNGYLDQTNGGFTVFGEVTPATMAVVDAIAALQRVNAGSPFDAMPVIGTVGATVQKSNLVLVTNAVPISNNWQGLWWNANESGWGMSVTQHGSQIFVAIYTYDASGHPLWYVIPNCPVGDTGCSGEVYRVKGGTAPTTAWTGAELALTAVGTGTLTFGSATSGTFDFTIDGVAGSKAITQQIWATSGPTAAVDYTDLWWNANESGWGVSLTQQFGIIFAAWFTYDAAGQPIWYVASNCAMNGAGCTGDLYQVAGGAGLAVPWTAVSPPTVVGQVNFAFTDKANALMTYTLNGVSTARKITRQLF